MGLGGAVNSLRLLALLLLAGCTSIGAHNQAVLRQLDFGAKDTVELCLYLDEGITEDQGRALIDEAWRDEAPLYDLEVKIASVTRWRRPAFMMDGIIGALRREPLTPDCDRILALIGRHLGDVVWGLLLPEYLGAVDDETLTHGYVIAQRASLNQLFEPPRSVVRHELYHLLGCEEHFAMEHCYQRIASLKRTKQALGSDFFPAWDMSKKAILVSREAVNARLAGSSGAR
jgi:hypothetical protein